MGGIHTRRDSLLRRIKMLQNESEMMPLWGWLGESDRGKQLLAYLELRLSNLRGLYKSTSIADAGAMARIQGADEECESLLLNIKNCDEAKKRLDSQLKLCYSELQSVDALAEQVSTREGFVYRGDEDERRG